MVNSPVCHRASTETQTVNIESVIKGPYSCDQKFTATPHGHEWWFWTLCSVPTQSVVLHHHPWQLEQCSNIHLIIVAKHKTFLKDIWIIRVCSYKISVDLEVVDFRAAQIFLSAHGNVKLFSCGQWRCCPAGLFLSILTSFISSESGSLDLLWDLGKVVTHLCNLYFRKVVFNWSSWNLQLLRHGSKKLSEFV